MDEEVVVDLKVCEVFSTFETFFGDVERNSLFNSICIWVVGHHILEADVLLLKSFANFCSEKEVKQALVVDSSRASSAYKSPT